FSRCWRPWLVTAPRVAKLDSLTLSMTPLGGAGTIVSKVQQTVRLLRIRGNYRKKEGTLD
ncbi:MAG TPA: hypothetical protein VHU84_08090, partial [Lacipirellulaceae bacterium]|nr:hypothetical protein [Lacipirellulaceae bacterium]